MLEFFAGKLAHAINQSQQLPLWSEDKVPSMPGAGCLFFLHPAGLIRFCSLIQLAIKTGRSELLRIGCSGSRALFEEMCIPGFPVLLALCGAMAISIQPLAGRDRQVYVQHILAYPFLRHDWT